MAVKLSDSVSKGDVLAVGDIHARLDVLEALIEKVSGTGAVLIFLGDLIDRGGQDLEVLELVKDVVTDPEKYGLQSAHCLKGNHEQMFIDTCESPLLQYHNHWVRNGGNFLVKKTMKDLYCHWLKSLPIYITSGDTLFIHAGVVPGKNPADYLGSKEGVDTLLWIRKPFLTKGSKIKKWSSKLKRVVHGHTISDSPVIKKDRIGIDTGAVFTGNLTVFNSTKNSIFTIQKGL